MRLSIRTKAFVSFTLFVLLSLAIGAIAYFNLSTIHSSTHRIEEFSKEIEDIGRLELAIDRLVMPANDYIITGDPKYKEDFTKLSAQVEEALRRLEDSESLYKEEGAILKDGKEVYAQIREISLEIFNISNPISNKDATALMEKMDYEVRDPLLLKLGRWHEINHREIEEARRSAKIIRDDTSKNLFMEIAATLAIALCLGYLFTQYHTRPIKELLAAASSMASGDLDKRVNIYTNDEIGDLGRSFNSMVASIKASAIAQAELYEKVKQQTEELRALYEDLNKRNRDLEILNTVTKAVHQSLDLEEIYKIALDLVIGLENVDMAMIYLVDEDKKEAILQAHRNLPEDYIRRAGRVPYPKGITWRVINTGEIINIEDVQKNQDIGPAGRDLGHHGVLGIPITLEGRVIGVIWFISYKERKFDEREVSLLSALGNQIAIAIAKAKLYKDSVKKREQIESVYEVSKTLNMDLSLDVVLNNIVGNARELVEARYCALAILDENKELNKLITNLTPEEHTLIRELPMGRGIWGTVFKEGKALLLDDVTKTPGAWGFPANHLPMKSFLGQPITLKGKILGAIYLTDKKGGVPFGRDDQELIETLASGAAVAIENARLFDKVAKSEGELKEAYEKLKELDIMKDEFISMASHELRTPLSAIGGYVSMLLEGDFGELSSEATEALIDMNTATRRLIGLINDILEASIIEQGRLRFRISEFDLGVICQDVVTGLSAMAQESGVKLAYQQPLDVESSLVLTDTDKVRQVLTNLIGNALKFTRGEVTITHRFDSNLIITDVIDNGSGIPPRDQEILFQKFQQLDKTLSGAHRGGTGLGLYISQQLAKGMGGDVWLERSVVGQGSTFSFSLPRAKAPLGEERKYLSEHLVEA